LGRIIKLRGVALKKALRRRGVVETEKKASSSPDQEAIPSIGTKSVGEK